MTYYELSARNEWTGRTSASDDFEKSIKTSICPPSYGSYDAITWAGGTWAVSLNSTKIALPDNVSRAQGKIALIEAGYWDAVKQFVESIPDDNQREIALTSLNDTQYWQRQSGFLSESAQAVGLSETQISDLFIRAIQIEV